MIAPYGQLSVAVSMTSPSGKSQQRKSPKCTWLSLTGLWTTRRISLLSYFLRCGLSIMLCRLLLVSAKQRNESNSTFDCSILSAKKYWTVSPVKPFSTTRFLHCCPRSIQENIQMFLLGLRYSQKLAELQLIWVNALMLNLNGGWRAAKDFAVSLSQLETLKQREIKNSDHAWQNHALGQSMIQNASKSNLNMNWRITVESLPRGWNIQRSQHLAEVVNLPDVWAWLVVKTSSHHKQVQYWRNLSPSNQLKTGINHHQLSMWSGDATGACNGWRSLNQHFWKL